jgi:hypothetical protein
MYEKNRGQLVKESSECSPDPETPARSNSAVLYNSENWHPRKFKHPLFVDQLPTSMSTHLSFLSSFSHLSGCSSLHYQIRSRSFIDARTLAPRSYVSETPQSLAFDARESERDYEGEDSLSGGPDEDVNRRELEEEVQEFGPKQPPFRRMKTWGGILFRKDCGIDWDEWKGLLQIPTSDRPWHRIKKQTAAAMPSVTGRRLRVSSSAATDRSARARGRGSLGTRKNPPKKTTSRTEVSVPRRNPQRQKRSKI